MNARLLITGPAWALETDVTTGPKFDERTIGTSFACMDKNPFIARAPGQACVYLLRASIKLLGALEYAVEGHGEWTAYPVSYFQSCSASSPFPKIWNRASLADRRRLLADVRRVAISA